MDYGYLILVFIVMGAVTFAERALPFAASKWLQKQRWVRSLGDFLPLAIMVLLTVHAATDSAVARGSSPAPEIVSIAFAFALQWFVKNPLISIFSGTALYVAWVNGYLPF
mgnify:CR=1 FL=1|jgi:branched-chain amino acid transport protein